MVLSLRVQWNSFKSLLIALTTCTPFSAVYFATMAFHSSVTFKHGSSYLVIVEQRDVELFKTSNTSLLASSVNLGPTSWPIKLQGSDSFDHVSPFKSMQEVPSECKIIKLVGKTFAVC